MRIVFVIVLISVCSRSIFSQDVAYSRRLFNVSTFLSQLSQQPDPTYDGKRKGAVLIVFRTSEAGTVLEAKAIEGPKALMDAAVQTVKNWKFKPATISGGEPVEMISAAILDFSTDPITIRASEPMTAEQLSPTLKCLNALLHGDPAVVDMCGQQLEAIEHSGGSALDRLTAEDEFGIALLRAGDRSREALRHFDTAIKLAPGSLTASDAEWAYLYWHRAVAERESGMNAEAEKDFATAEESMTTAAQGIGNGAAAAHYRGLAANIVKQRESLPHN
jgi:hypothetical protein